LEHRSLEESGDEFGACEQLLAQSDVTVVHPSLELFEKEGEHAVLDAEHKLSQSYSLARHVVPAMHRSPCMSQIKCPPDALEEPAMMHGESCMLSQLLKGLCFFPVEPLREHALHARCFICLVEHQTSPQVKEEVLLLHSQQDPTTCDLALHRQHFFGPNVPYMRQSLILPAFSRSNIPARVFTPDAESILDAADGEVADQPAAAQFHLI